MKKFARKTYSKKRKSSRRPSRKVSKRVTPIKKMIRREIARNIENKQANYLNLGLDNVPSNSATAAAKIIDLSPSAVGIAIAQGTSQGGRIGNKIKIKSAKFKGTIHALPHNATTNTFLMPLQVMMFIFYDKENPTQTPDPFGANDFFQFGSTSADFRNDLVDCWAPINSDRYVLKYRRNFKVGYSNYGGTGTVPAQQSYANNDFKFNQNFSIDLTPMLVKEVKYNDNNTDPTTRGLFCMIVPVNADGSAIGATEIPARTQFSVDYTYEDA